MGMKHQVKTAIARIGEKQRLFLLGVFLGLVYFGLITPYALVWRWLGLRGLKRSRAKWEPVAESSDTPNLFNRAV
jgi:hypothetical protein